MLAHPLSRFVALSFIFTHSYVRENEDSKAKPLAKKMSDIEFLVAFILAIIPLAVFGFYFQNYQVLLIFIPLFFVKWYLGRFFVKWIGGYTGDCLGATQQVAEVVIYL